MKLSIFSIIRLTLKHRYWFLVLNSRKAHEIRRVSTWFVRHEFRSGWTVAWLADGQRGWRRRLSRNRALRPGLTILSCPLGKTRRRLTPEVDTLQLPLVLFPTVSSSGELEELHQEVPAVNFRQFIYFLFQLTKMFTSPLIVTKTRKRKLTIFCLSPDLIQSCKDKNFFFLSLFPLSVNTK